MKRKGYRGQMTTKLARSGTWQERDALHGHVARTKVEQNERVTDLLRNFIVSPVGTSAERDEELRAIWREAELQGR